MIKNNKKTNDKNPLYIFILWLLLSILGLYYIADNKLGCESELFGCLSQMGIDFEMMIINFVISFLFINIINLIKNNNN